jgi:hypothetical protein
MAHDAFEQAQPLLPFAGVHGEVPSSSSTAPMPDQAVGPFFGPDDPDAGLESMSNDDLREHLIELSEAVEQGEEVVLRRLKIIFLLQRRGVAKRRWARVAVEPSPAKSRGGGGPRKVGFRTAIDWVTKTGGVLGAEKFAEWLADDLWDVRSIPDFRRIANGLRDGVLTRELVSEAWRRARRPGVRNRSAFFRRWVFDRSSQVAAQGRDGQLRLR